MKIKDRSKNSTQAKAKQTAAGKAANLYLMLMLGIFPLFYRNNYINMMESKWLFFMVTTLIAFVAVTALWIAGIMKNKPAGFPKLYAPDIALLVFGAGVLVSWFGTISIDYFKEAWDGSQGKMAGVFLYLILILAYFIVSRFAGFNKVILHVYLWANFLVFSLAILNHFMVDPLGMYKNLMPDQYWMFCSTMGNINVLSGYLCVFVPVTIACFIQAKSSDETLLFGSVMTVSFMGVVAANADAGILGVAAGFLFLMWFSFESMEKLARFFTALALFFGSSLIIGSMDDSFADTVKEPLETVPAFVSKSIFNRIALAVFVVLAVCCFRFAKRKWDETVLKKMRNLFFGVIGAVAAAAILAFIYFSAVNTTTDLGRWDTYLRFSDLWGSSRGFTWRRTLMMYFDNYTPFQKIFGFGPDLMIVPYHTYFHEAIMEKMGAYLADAHSETLQHLGSLGIVGMVSYHAFELAALVRFVKNKKADAFVIAISAGVVGYMMQGLFCSPQTISTPSLFLMAGLGEALIRQES